MATIAVVGDRGSYPLQFANALARATGSRILFYGPKKPPLGIAKRVVSFEGFPNDKGVWSTFWYFLQIPAAAIRDRPDIIHIDFTLTLFGASYFALIPFVLLLPLLRLSANKMAVTVHDIVSLATLADFFQKSAVKTYLAYVLARFFFRFLGKADHLYVHFETQKKTLVEEYHIDAKRVTTVAFGVEDFGTEPSEVEARLASQLRGRDVVLFFGTIGPRKGIEYLVEGFAEVLDRFPDAVLVIAGPADSKYAEYHRELCDLGNKLIGARFMSLGYLSPTNAHGVIGLSKVIVLPYVYSYASPSILYWAIGHRKPVIASKIGTLAEELAEYESDLLVRPRSAEDIARALTNLFLQPDLYGRSVQFMTRKAAENSWDKVAREMFASYSGHALK